MYFFLLVFFSFFFLFCFVEQNFDYSWKGNTIRVSIETTVVPSCFQRFIKFKIYLLRVSCRNFLINGKFCIIPWISLWSNFHPLNSYRHTIGHTSLHGISGPNFVSWPIFVVKCTSLYVQQLEFKIEMPLVERQHKQKYLSFPESSVTLCCFVTRTLRYFLIFEILFQHLKYVIRLFLMTRSILILFLYSKVAVSFCFSLKMTIISKNAFVPNFVSRRRFPRTKLATSI